MISCLRIVPKFSMPMSLAMWLRSGMAMAWSLAMFIAPPAGPPGGWAGDSSAALDSTAWVGGSSFISAGVGGAALPLWWTGRPANAGRRLRPGFGAVATIRFHSSWEGRRGGRVRLRPGSRLAALRVARGPVAAGVRLRTGRLLRRRLGRGAIGGDEWRGGLRAFLRHFFCGRSGHGKKLDCRIQGHGQDTFRAAAHQDIT